MTVHVDPFDSDHVVVQGANRFILPNGNGEGHMTTLVETRDAGQTWQSAAQGLKMANFYRLDFSPFPAGVLLVSTDSNTGPFLSSSRTETRWHDISTGLMAGLTNLPVSNAAFAPPEAVAPGAFYVVTNNGVFTTAPADLVVLPTVTISPSLETVIVGGFVQFTAAEPIEWSVLAIPGVDVGTIDASGLYRAPAVVPPAGAVTVWATAVNTGARAAGEVHTASATADGTFVPVTTLPSGQTIHGDLDGDGTIDVLSVGIATLSFRKGLGNGVFAPPAPTASIIAVDVNDQTPGNLPPRTMRFVPNASDPDLAAGDFISKFRWSFGDGTPVMETKTASAEIPPLSISM